MKSGWTKKHWFGEKTSTKDLIRALRILKVRCRRKLQRLKKHEILPYLCIVHMRVPKARWSHWVVFKGKDVYDPYWGKNPQWGALKGKNPKKWPDGFRPTSYLEIL